MAYGNPHKKGYSSKKMAKGKKKVRKTMTKVGQRKSYRMTGRAPGNR